MVCNLLRDEHLIHHVAKSVREVRSQTISFINAHILIPRQLLQILSQFWYSVHRKETSVIFKDEIDCIYSLGICA